MQLIIYFIIFCVYCVIPLWLQLILFIASLFVSPGVGNIAMVVGMVIGYKAKKG